VTYSVRIIKGNRTLGITKGYDYDMIFEAVPGYGVRARLPECGWVLWVSGNRVHTPTLKVGDTLNLHRGDTNKITVEVIKVQ